MMTTDPAPRNDASPTARRDLSDKPVRKTVETDTYAEFMRRAVRAYSRRVGDGDVEALRSLCAFRAEVDKAIDDAVSSLHAFGYSWSEIASRLDITKQSAYDRWGKK
jgi:hypothetical protein